MGGKTQQRVAGNVKPTKSGRIRDLLIDKQHGVGNIITFSTLSNNQKQNPLKEAYSQDTTTKSSDTATAPESAETQLSESSPASKANKPILVVKRIGNRDYYTRVRFTENLIEQDKSKLVPSTSDSVLSQSGKLEDDTSESPIKEEENLIDNIELTDNKVLEEPTRNEEVDVPDFESLIEQLDQHQGSLTPIGVDSLDDLDFDRIAKENELIILLKTLVENFKEDLSIEEWDLINRSLNKWISLILNSNQLHSSPARTSFCVDTLNFINQLISLVKFLEENRQTAIKDFPMMQLLLDEWENFYSTKAYQDLIALFFRLVSRDDQSIKDTQPIIEALASIVIDIDPRLAIVYGVLENLNSEVEFDPESEIPNDSVFCNYDEKKFKGFSSLCNLLRSNCRVITVTAHTMLSKIMGAVCNSVETKLFITEQDDADNLLLFPPKAITSVLTFRDSMMAALLSDYRVGDISVTVEPNSDSYTCTLAYLLIWDLVINFIVGVDKELQHKLIHCLKKLGLLQRLLDNVFMLVPPLGERNSLTYRLESCKNSIQQANKNWNLSDFLKSPLKGSIIRPTNEIELTALHVYFSVASHMPVTVRKWYNNNYNKKLCNLVNEYTVKYISNVICSLEMESVQEKCDERADEDKVNNLVIKARPNAREVYAVYTRDEFRMELTIKLPINYPLGPVQIDGGKRVGVTDLKWRGWLLRLTTFLAHQNGPILDGVDLWRRNIDKRFEGIEKCMICFSILHSNYQLPKKKCQTCSKMFHNLCLYKWFESSGNSTCPLCRNIW